MTALAESQHPRRPLHEVLAAEMVSREGRWASVARIATGSAASSLSVWTASIGFTARRAIEQHELEVQHVAAAMH